MMSNQMETGLNADISELESFLQKLSKDERVEFEQKLKEMVQREEEMEIHFFPSPAKRLMMSWGREKIGEIKI